MAEETKEPTLFPCTRRTAEVFTFKGDSEYAVFTLDIRERYYGLGIESSFGGYNYAWGYPGDSFYEFLAHLNCHYLLEKMIGCDRVFDGEATAKAIRKAILELRRAGDCTREQARSEWGSVSDMESSGSEADFQQWMNDTRLFSDSPSYEFHKTCGGSRTREFAALYDKFWPSLAAEMRKRAAEVKAAAPAAEVAHG